MATTFEEDFEGGSDGNTVSTLNTGYDSVSGTPTFTTDAAVGSLAADCDATGSSTRMDESTTASLLYRRFYVKPPSLPGGNLYIATNTTGASTRADMRIEADGTLAIRNGFVAVWSSTTKLQAGKWARVEWKLDTSSQVQECRLFTGANLHGTTASDSSGSQAFDKGAFDNIGLGIIQNTTGRVIIDAVKDSDSGWVGPASVPNQPPTITYPDDTMLLGTIDTEQSITATAVDNDGTVSAWEWSWDSVTTPSGDDPTLSGTTTATVAFTPTEGGVYRLKVRAQDDDSAWSDYGYATVSVPATVGVVIEDVSGDWTETGGTGVGILSDDNDSTYYQAATSGISTQRFRLSPFVQPSAFSINVRHFLTASVAGSASAVLYEGSSTRKSWSLGPEQTAKTTTLTMSSEEIAAISDWTNLFLELTWQQQP